MISIHIIHHTANHRVIHVCLDISIRYFDFRVLSTRHLGRLSELGCNDSVCLHFVSRPSFHVGFLHEGASWKKSGLPVLTCA